MATRTVVRSQVRGFVLVWMMITLLVGIATFFAIYVAYDVSSSRSDTTSPLSPNNDSAAVAAIPTSNATPVPTREIPPTVEPTPVPVVAAQSANNETSQSSEESAQGSGGSEPSTEEEEALPPIAQTEFTPGIQVQNSIDLNPEVQRAWMNDVRGLGLDTFKQQIRWSEIELEPGEYDWGVLDLVMPIADEYGFNVVGSIVAAPDWAREEGVDLEEDGPPADPQTFANFLTALLERYPGQFHALEIWNETNLEREWASSRGISAENYIDLLRVAYEMIKNIEPGIIVISGAPSPTGGFVDGGVVRAIDDFDYMDQMIAAGLLNYADCIGVHHNGYNVSPLYRWDEIPNDPDALFRGPFDNPHHSWSFRSTLETYANKIQVAGGDQQLCITEYGWASVEDMDGYPENFEFAVDNTLEEQAQFTAEALELMTTEWDFVWIAILWNLNYGPQAGWSTTSDNTPYSLIGPEFSKRPAYTAIAEWAANR